MSSLKLSSRVTSSLVQEHRLLSWNCYILVLLYTVSISVCSRSCRKSDGEYPASRSPPFSPLSFIGFQLVFIVLNVLFYQHTKGVTDLWISVFRASSHHKFTVRFKCDLGSVRFQPPYLNGHKLSRTTEKAVNTLLYKTQSKWIKWCVCTMWSDAGKRTAFAPFVWGVVRIAPTPL